MEYRFLCPHCGQKLKAEEESAGKPVDCPKCGKEFLVPPPPMDAMAGMAPPPLPPVYSAPPPPPLYAASAPPPAPAGPNLEGELTCPVCWLRFDKGDIMHIAVHDSLRGDPVLGEDHPQRFLATRFNDAGQAIDAMGLACSDIACPHCRRKLPPGFLEIPHHIISIVGDQSAGKSYYLSVLTKMLPGTFYRRFNSIFQDSDPTGNAPINDMRKSLFGAQSPAEAKLAKTVFEGAMYERLPRQGRTVALPRPFVYTLTPLNDAENRCALIFYDNAGEHFQPGVNVIEQPGAQHVASAAGIVYLFDPFNSPEFRRRLRRSNDPQLEKPIVDQQDIILAEMRARIQQLRNLRVGQKTPTPVAFVIGKCDAWGHLLKSMPLSNPLANGGFDLPALESNSEHLRKFLNELCPGVVANTEALSQNVRYFAVSSFGHTPIKIGPGEYVPDPLKLEPMMVEVPLLWILSQVDPTPLPEEHLKKVDK